MKDAVIIDFGNYQKQNDPLTETQQNSVPCISDELINAIQLLIQRLRDSNPLKNSN